MLTASTGHFHFRAVQWLTSFPSNPHMLHFRFACSSFCNVPSNRRELFFSHGAVFSFGSAMMNPTNGEVHRAMFWYLSNVPSRSTKALTHRITFDTIFEHDTMGSVLKKLGIGSGCRLAGAAQVLTRVVTMCSSRYRRIQTRFICSLTCRRAGVNDMYDAAQCIHLFLFATRCFRQIPKFCVRAFSIVRWRATLSVC